MACATYFTPDNCARRAARRARSENHGALGPSECRHVSLPHARRRVRSRRRRSSDTASSTRRSGSTGNADRSEAAREKVRVARALEQLPEIADAFAKGEISYSKVRAMTRVATAANESVLVHARATAQRRTSRSS